MFPAACSQSVGPFLSGLLDAFFNRRITCALSYFSALFSLYCDQSLEYCGFYSFFSHPSPFCSTSIVPKAFSDPPGKTRPLNDAMAPLSSPFQGSPEPSAFSSLLRSLFFFFFLLLLKGPFPCEVPTPSPPAQDLLLFLFFFLLPHFPFAKDPNLALFSSPLRWSSFVCSAKCFRLNQRPFPVHSTTPSVFSPDILQIIFLPLMAKPAGAPCSDPINVPLPS